MPIIIDEKIAERALRTAVKLNDTETVKALIEAGTEAWDSAAYLLATMHATGETFEVVRKAGRAQRDAYEKAGWPRLRPKLTPSA